MAHSPLHQHPARLALLAGLLFPAITLNSARLAPPADDTPTETSVDTPPPTDSPIPSETPLFTETLAPSPTSPETPTPGETSTIPSTSTASATQSATLVTESPPPTSYPALSVLINEVAWAGTLASTSDEWIELYNASLEDIDLAGWVLSDGGDITIALSGLLPAGGLFLLERTNNSTIADVAADQIYTGNLYNDGETLVLRDPTEALVDSANADGGTWPAGSAATRASMQRIGGPDLPGNWMTFPGAGGNGHDADGNPIAGTPRAPNAFSFATPTPTPALTPFPALALLIHEVAWAGTLASSSDEWIELFNASPGDVDLAGWTLSDGEDIAISLSGMLPAGGYFLLERTDDTTISDLPADQIYSGGMDNGGDTLWLRDPTGALIDSANADGGGWPAGSSASKASMERRGGEDRSWNWGTFTGYFGVGHDCEGRPIPGTPRQANSLAFPTPEPTWVPGAVVINEVLIRPHYDWEGAGGVTPGDEFIELYNRGPYAVYLRDWMLDDGAETGSRPYTLPGVTISPGGFAVFFRTRTGIALNDTGDEVRLLGPRGEVFDTIRYLRVRAYNLSYGRLPDGSNHMAYGLWPTAGRANLIFVEPTPIPILSPDCPLGGIPQPRLPRLARHPAVARWMASLGLAVCR